MLASRASLSFEGICVLCARVRVGVHACVHACARRSRNVCGFRKRGWIWGGRSDGKVNTDVAARKRRLPANANVARGAWRPWESRRHGADIVPHLVNEEEEGDGAKRVPPRELLGNFRRTLVEF